MAARPRQPPEPRGPTRNGELMASNGEPGGYEVACTEDFGRDASA
jgi:hypothetical protein